VLQSSTTGVVTRHPRAGRGLVPVLAGGGAPELGGVSSLGEGSTGQLARERAVAEMQRSRLLRATVRVLEERG
jgi:hypothetical protein